MNDKNELSDETVILIEYADYTTEMITVNELKKRMTHYNIHWKAGFFQLLSETGSAYGFVSRYSIVKTKKDEL